MNALMSMKVGIVYCQGLLKSKILSWESHFKAIRADVRPASHYKTIIEHANKTLLKSQMKWVGRTRKITKTMMKKRLSQLLNVHLTTTSIVVPATVVLLAMKRNVRVLVGLFRGQKNVLTSTNVNMEAISALTLATTPKAVLNVLALLG